MTTTTTPAEQPTAVEFLRRSWIAEPARQRVIRRELREWLSRLDVTPEQVDDVVLAIDEAVANVVRHAYPDGAGPVEVTLWTEGPVLNAEIADHGSWRPAGEITSDDRGGRGLLLMQRMVETVLVRFDRRGSRVLLRHRFGGRHSR